MPRRAIAETLPYYRPVQIDLTAIERDEPRVPALAEPRGRGTFGHEKNLPTNPGKSPELGRKALFIRGGLVCARFCAEDFWRRRKSNRDGGI